MAMKPCKECEQPVSTKAKACPNCGADAPTRSFNRPFIWIVAIGGAVIYVFLVLQGVV